MASKLDPFREYVLARMLAEEEPFSNAEVTYDEIRARGYSGGRSILKEFMQPFREMSKQKVTERFETPPGKHIVRAPRANVGGCNQTCSCYHMNRPRHALCAISNARFATGPLPA